MGLGYGAAGVRVQSILGLGYLVFCFCSFWRGSVRNGWVRLLRLKVLILPGSPCTLHPEP